jgi:PAS domain S-box-containing protein
MASIQRKERERDELMEQLRKNQKFLRNVLDSMPSMIVGVDCDKNITHWNQAAAIRTKVNYDDALGQNLLTLFPFLYQEIERVDLAIRTRQPQPKERLPQKAKGKVWFAEVSIFPLIANGIQGAVVRVDDVTDQVRIEEMMVQSEKMLSVGGLAAGMAHEINNPLAGILQNTQVIQSRLLKVTPKTMKEAEALGLDWDVFQRFLNNRQINQMLQSVMDSGQRAAQIVKNMLSFARKNEGDFDAHDPGSLLDATVNLASNDYDLKKKYDFKKIKIVRNYQKTPRIRCNGSKIQQVFLNLLKNAAEALYESPSNPEPTIFLNIANDTKQSVVIEIGDNGPGIPDPLKKRVFEPFFTTKPVGVGTGLGLSVSYFIITENHKGSLRVSSLEPQGTVFTITLPFQPDFSSETHLQEPSS